MLSCQSQTNFYFWFLDFGARFRRHTEQLATQELSSTENWKTGIHFFAGEAIIRKLGLDRADWNTELWTKDNCYTRLAYSSAVIESGKI